MPSKAAERVVSAAQFAFNSLFEMLKNLPDKLKDLGRRISFNSLFEMPVAYVHHPGAVAFRLSILYLRCTYFDGYALSFPATITKLSILYLRCGGPKGPSHDAMP